MRLTQETSKEYLAPLGSRSELEKNKVSGVRTILVVLSSRGMVFDVEALRQKIPLVYPDAGLFFRTTSGKPLGMSSPQNVDLLIDFTGPGQRQGWFYARKLRRMSRFAIGRNAGLFRKGLYDRVFDEKKIPQPSHDVLERERLAQREVLALAGVAVVAVADATADKSQIIALELPPLAHR